MSQATVSVLDEHGALGGRLHLLRPDALNTRRRDLYDYLLSQKVNWAESAGFQARLADGRLIGPFNVFLHSPAMSRAYNAWIDSEAEYTSLADDVRQIIILTFGGVWDAAYEVYAHEAVGRGARLSNAAMTAVTRGIEPDELSPAARAAFRFTLALARDRQVSDELYAATVHALTLQGVADMVQLIALYLSTSAFLNAFSVPAPNVSGINRHPGPTLAPGQTCPESSSDANRGNRHD